MVRLMACPFGSNSQGSLQIRIDIESDSKISQFRADFMDGQCQWQPGRIVNARKAVSVFLNHIGNGLCTGVGLFVIQVAY